MIGDDHLIWGGGGGVLTVFVNKYSGHPKLENNNSVFAPKKIKNNYLTWPEIQHCYNRK